MSVKGIFREIHGDARYSDETFYYLQAGRHYYALKSRAEPRVRSGAKVTVHGTLSGNTIDLTSGAMTTDVPAPRISAIGTKTVLVINVVWPGASLTATASDEQNFMFGTDTRTVASYYKEVSYGQLTWTGTETPDYAITDPGTCDLYALANQAESAATSGGYTPSNYDAIMINAPKLYCGAAGYGEIGGKHTWVQDGLYNLSDGYAREVPTHEIGHSLGLYHSHGLECGAVTVSLACLDNASANNEEYGNAWDVMGNNWPGDVHDSVTWFSAKQELLLGWLSGSRLNTVTSSGTYSLTPLETTGTTSPQVLVINTPQHSYYVEYRQPIGQDAFMSAYPAATHSIHISTTGSSGTDAGPFALDFSPNSDTSCVYCDWYDAPLAIGRSFTDPENTFTVSAVSENGTTATVAVNFLTGTSYPLAVTKAGTGSGTVTSSPAGINCGTTCSASFAPGASVTLSATASSGSVFAGWAGACAGTTPSCVVTMTSARTVTATFNPVTTTRYEETAPTYDGWSVAGDPSASGGSWRTSKTTGNTGAFTFSGSAVTWVTHRGPTQGIAAVAIDGASKGTVDLYSARGQAFRKSFTGLASRRHTIVIRVTGTRNAASTGKGVIVDAFIVGSTTSQDSSTVKYDSWKAASSASASGGKYRSSGTAGATCTLRFTGTSVDWVTATGPGWGTAEIYVDGTDKGTVDLYASAAHWRTVKSYGGLSAGTHTIKVKVLGTKNAAATSTSVAIDAFAAHS